LPENSCDVILVDEAHRIDRIALMDWSSGNRRQKTREQLKSSLPIVREIIKAAKVSVFFIDEKQIIQPSDANRIENIYTAAKQENAQVTCYHLEAQHRLAGSLEFIDWIDYIFDSPVPTLRQLGDIGSFQFEIVEDPAELIQIHESWESQSPNQ
ncbi:MAG: DNA/RNA helicase domain-containing protein, partial [Sphaerospermopsis kisseleviana]